MNAFVMARSRRHSLIKAYSCRHVAVVNSTSDSRNSQLPLSKSNPQIAFKSNAHTLKEKHRRMRVRVHVLMWRVDGFDHGQEEAVSYKIIISIRRWCEL